MQDRLTIRIDAELLQETEAAAKANKKTVSRYARDALEKANKATKRDAAKKVKP